MYKYCFLACFCGSQRVQRLRGRTNLSTNSGKPIKRLDRLAPNLAHMYRFIWEWIYAKQIATRDTRGHMCGLRGSTIQNLGKLSNGWTDWYHIWYTSADSSGNGHLLNTIRRSLPQRHFWFFFGVTNSKVWEAVKGLDRLAPNLAHMCRFIWEWINAKQIAPRDTRGTEGV